MLYVVEFLKAEQHDFFVSVSYLRLIMFQRFASTSNDRKHNHPMASGTLSKETRTIKSVFLNHNILGKKDNLTKGSL